MDSYHDRNRNCAERHQDRYRYDFSGVEAVVRAAVFVRNGLLHGGRGRDYVGGSSGQWTG